MKEYNRSTARIVRRCRVVIFVVAENMQGEEEVVADDVTEEEAKDLVKFFLSNEPGPKVSR